MIETLVSAGMWIAVIGTVCCVVAYFAIPRIVKLLSSDD